MKGRITRKHWGEIERALAPCPVCSRPVKLMRSDGSDCRISRECRSGFYIRCFVCDLLFGYEPDRGGTYMVRDLDALIIDWGQNKIRPKRVLYMSYQITWAAARVNAGLTQVEVAKRLGTSQPYITQTEIGRKEVHPALEQSLSKLYQVRPEWIRKRAK